MKLFVVLGILIIGILAVRANDEFNLTKECASEVSRYSDCLSGLNIYEIETKKQLDNFCSLFNQSKCKNFIDDISKTTYACTAKDETAYDDTYALEEILEIKMLYIMTCTKTKDGSYCPVSKMFRENYMNLKDQEQEKITDEQLKVITQDCKIEECNKNMTTMFSNYDLLLKMMSIMFGDYYENDNEPYFLSQLLDIIRDPNENNNNICREEYAKYAEFVEEIDKIDIESGEQFQQFCSVFDKPKYKYILDSMSTTEFVCTPSSNMLTKVLEGAETIVEIKINYLMYCAKDKKGNYCPVTDYAIIHYDIINETQDDITDEQLDVITKDCKNEECNERMLMIINSYDEYLRILSQIYDFNADYENNPYFMSQLLFGYQEFYKNKKCDAQDIYHQEKIDFCESDLVRFSECMTEINDITIDSETTINSFCYKINTSSKCEEFLYDIDNQRLSCFSVSNPNKDNFLAGMDIYKAKLQYLMYCSEDFDGNRCPVSDYIVNNYEEAIETKQDTLTEQQLEVIKNDCLDYQCYFHRNTVINIYNDYVTLYKEFIGDDVDEELNFAYNILKNYGAYYVERQCDSGGGGSFDFHSPSPECEVEYNKYSECMMELSEMITSLHTSNDIRKMCNIFSSTKCERIVNDIYSPKSNCFNTISSSQPNISDYFYGISMISVKLQYLTYCVKDPQGNMCPLSEMMTVNYEMETTDDEENDKTDNENDKDDGKDTDDIFDSPEELKVIADDCRISTCNFRMLLIKKYYEYLQNVLGSDEAISGDNVIMFIDNYLEGNCSGIDNSDSSLDTGIISSKSNSNDNDLINGNPTDACTAEVKKYQKCLSSFDPLEKIDSKEDINMFCSVMDAEPCKEFIDDINKSESACVSIQKPYLLDILSGGVTVAVRAQYQLYCAKDSSGKVCPVTQLLLDNYGQIDKLSEITPQQLEIITSDCKDSSCYARMTAFIEFSENIPKLKENLTTMTSNELIKEVVKNNIDFDVDSSISDLLNKVSSYYQSKECGTADNTISDENKFSSDVSSHLNPNINDYFIGLDYLSNKLNYLLYCSEDKDDNQCPISDYHFNCVEEINDTEQYTLTEKQLDIIKDDCRDDKCTNQRNIFFILLKYI
ncbi:hypothetical protein PIROE2DRAFT_62460 [Piromyces sp. E2]|nr:hypothetical protein PIROE2DRAFT_62460 [Piromyces sp. E2]|eukprot:OUM61518.1 hypothetical protein PIROE2DRAFT_62460 [Piromyces sp. E2]